jgi:class 3 adenylate cyclase
MNNASFAPSRASVVFIKVHEFARRPVLEQARVRAQLEAVIAVTMAGLRPEERIVLDAPDGAAIVILRNPGKALEMADLALAASAAGLNFCIGINHGAVQLAADGTDHEGPFGDAIATAASVAEFAAPASLVMSRSFRDALVDAAPALDASVRPAGTGSDRALRTHELFALDRDAAARRRRRFIAYGAFAMVVFVGTGVALRMTAGDAPEQFGPLAGGYAETLRGFIEKIRFW